MDPIYKDVVQLIERLHASFGEIIKLELDSIGIHDCNHIQGLMLYKIGETEMTVGEVSGRGCYLGSNVSYNIKKLVENAYLVQERSVHDRRSIRIKITDKGRHVCDHIRSIHERHAGMLDASNIGAEDLQAMHRTADRLDRMWQRARDLVPISIATGTRVALG